MVQDKGVSERRGARRSAWTGLWRPFILGTLLCLPGSLGAQSGTDKNKRSGGGNEEPVAFSERRFPFLNVKGFGARGDGTTDDTAAFQRAIDAAITGQEGSQVGHTILIPKGTYRITDTLLIKSVRGLHLSGMGIGSSRLLWDPGQPGALASDPDAVQSPPQPGSGDTLMFLVENSQFCTFESFSVANGDELPLRAAFHVRATSDDDYASLSNSFLSLLVDGGEVGIGRGFRLSVASGVNTRNASHILRNVTVQDYLDAAFSLESDLVKDVEFHSCHFHGNLRGLSGLASSRGESLLGQPFFGGSFRWYGGGGGGNRAADFDLGDVSDTILIAGGQFSASARFLHTGGPSGNQWPVIIQSVVWLDDMLGEFEEPYWPEAESLRIVNFQYRGPLILTGNQFGTPPDPVQGPQVAKESQILWNPGNNFGQFVFQGNYLASSKENPFKGPTATGAVVGIYPTIQSGNIIESEDYGSSTSVLPMRTHVTSLSGSPTPSVGWLHTNRRYFKTGTGTAIVNLLHGVVGQEVTIHCQGERTLEHNANVQLRGSESFDMKNGDNITLVMMEEGKWVEVARTEAAP